MGPAIILYAAFVRGVDYAQYIRSVKPAGSARCDVIGAVAGDYGGGSRSLENMPMVVAAYPPSLEYYLYDMRALLLYRSCRAYGHAHPPFSMLMTAEERGHALNDHPDRYNDATIGRCGIITVARRMAEHIVTSA